MAKGKGKRKIGAGDVASNRYASHRYELIERLECGIVLEGTEVKALRTSGAQLKDGYASITKGELWLHSVHIPPYGPASRENHDPERPQEATAGIAHPRERDFGEGLLGVVHPVGHEAPGADPDHPAVPVASEHELGP